MKTNRVRITQALDTLTRGLFPFVERELQAVYKHDWHDAARGSFREGRGQINIKGNVVHWDLHALLTVLWDQWHRVFRHRLGPAERSLVSELREYRNRWAHQEEFDFDDTYRILDSVHRLLKATSAPETKIIAREKFDLLRRYVGRQAQLAYRKAQVARKRWLDFAVYVTCCASLVFVILQFFGSNASYLAAFFIAVFLFLANQRISIPPPMFFGPQECEGCGKIVYSDRCPYCEYASYENPFLPPDLAETPVPAKPPLRSRPSVSDLSQPVVG